MAASDIGFEPQPSRSEAVAAMAPVRLLLDSNISHALVVDDGLRTSLSRAAQSGNLELLVTHIQVDENLDHPDRDEGRRLVHAMMGVGVRAIPTYGLVLDVSRVGNAILFDEATAAMFEAFCRENPRHTQDGLLAATALHENAVLVTAENDKHRRRLLRSFPGLEVWQLADLDQFLERLWNKPPLAYGTVAAGSLQTPSFEGPGEVSTSILLSTGGLAQPQLAVSLAPSGARADPNDPLASFTYRIEQSPVGATRFSITVRRSGSGQEPARVFKWQLAPGTRPRS